MWVQGCCPSSPTPLSLESLLQGLGAEAATRTHILAIGCLGLTGTKGKGDWSPWFSAVTSPDLDHTWLGMLAHEITGESPGSIHFKSCHCPGRAPRTLTPSHSQPYGAPAIRQRKSRQLTQDPFILYSCANMGTCSFTKTGDLSIHCNNLCRKQGSQGSSCETLH